MSPFVYGVLVTFLDAVAKYLTRINFKEKHFIVAYKLKRYCPSWWGRHSRRNSRTAGHIAYVGKVRAESGQGVKTGL